MLNCFMGGVDTYLLSTVFALEWCEHFTVWKFTLGHNIFLHVEKKTAAIMPSIHLGECKVVNKIHGFIGLESFLPFVCKIKMKLQYGTVAYFVDNES